MRQYVGNQVTQSLGLQHECEYILQDAAIVLVLGPDTGAEPSMAAAKGRGIPYVATEFLDPLGKSQERYRPKVLTSSKYHQA